MANAGQHTIKYKREGDYGKLIPRVCPVEYQDGIKLFPGTCEACVYGRGPHSLTCCWEQQRKNLLINGAD